MPDLLRPRRGSGRSLLGALAVALLVLAALAVTPPGPAQAAVDPCGTGGNKIACENSKPGTPQSVWDVEGAGDESIQGFSTDISVNLGQRVDFKIDTNAAAYSITIYRTGYYGGDGARQIATVAPSVALPQTQPSCITDVSTELYDCGNWAVSASWNVPTTAVSGVYIARLYRADRNEASLITFIVRDDSSHSDVVFQTSDPTWQAYNDYGGSDFYKGAANGRSYKVSYNRPILTRGGPGGRDMYFSNEYPLVRFLEKNGYDVSYIAGVDTDRSGALLKNHKTFLSVGHDEYWSKGQRANVEAARDAGVNLQFLSGNEVYWKTRYEASADAGHTPYRTLTSYKETWADAKIDPSDEWTGTWRDPRFAATSKGAGVPENGLTGTMYQSNFSDLPITVSAAEGKLRLWRDTTLASLAAGATAQLAPHTVGYESDEDIDNGSRPAGLIRLSTTTGAVPQYLTDFGNTVVAGTTTHHLTLYRAASGALVFGAGTVQWTWGLDAVHDSAFAAEPADKRMQQAQVNLLADMGAQPLTLDSTLVAATRSTDTVGPSVTISAPADGSAQTNNTNVTITGTATDAAGRVAGVEVSTDGGGSWHPAVGTSSWSYTYVQHGVGSTPVKVRAVDDSANIGAAATRTLAVSCPCGIFGPVVPAIPAANDSGAAELGLRFSPTVDGFVSGVRFYKGTGNTGTHVGSLWSSSGQRLATVTFAGESATGWQSASFSSSVPVSAGQTYVVSYTAPAGHYAVQTNAFYAGGLAAPPLAVQGGFGAPAAGVFAGAGQFPSSSYQSANYYVDVAFTTTDTSPLIATGQSPLPDSSSVPVTSTVSATLSRAVAGTPTVTVKDPNGVSVAGATSYNTTTRVVTFTPSSALAGFVKYTVTLAATDSQGNAITTGKSWSFTSAKPAATPGVCPCTLFDDATAPAVQEVADTSAVTLGVRFSPTVNGTVTGVRFYKGPNNTGSHTGTLWSAAGAKLAEGTFGAESSSGWQTLTFAQPVTVTKGTEYVASYRTDVGRYSATGGAFSSADLSRVPLKVTSSAGAYSYANAFPGTSVSTSYLVDVLFQKGTPQLSVVSQDPAPGAVDVPRGTPVSVTFSDPVQAGATMTLTQQPAGTAIAGTTALDASGTRLTFTPSGLLPVDSDVRAQVSGVQSTDGASLATQTWTFHTRSTNAAAQSLFGDVLPQTVSANESSPIELGAAFVPAKGGTVTAIRFYKAADNLGTHTGSLWSSTGTRLATATFTGESASGWQTATLASPVTVAAGTTYVVSYLAPQGHYSYTGGFFSSPWTSGDLTAPSANNGRYLYGAGGGYPANSYGAANYFVDLVFKPTPASISVTDRSPASGATGVPRDATPTITLSAPVANGYSMTASQGSTAIGGTVTRSGDQQTLTFTPASALPAGADVTVTVAGVTSTEGATLPTQTWTFRTEAGATVASSLFTTQVPDNPDVSDNSAIELGTVFTPSVDGTVTKIRFYKGAGSSGVHTGSIWSATGTRLGTVTFTGETASGWQSATLATPVPLTAGQSYVVSYYAPAGHYAATGGFFAAPLTSGPLTAPAGQNGRYLYGSGGGFPTGSYNASSYFVDVVFRSAAP